MTERTMTDQEALDAMSATLTEVDDWTPASDFLDMLAQIVTATGRQV